MLRKIAAEIFASNSVVFGKAHGSHQVHLIVVIESRGLEEVRIPLVLLLLVLCNVHSFENLR